MWQEASLVEIGPNLLAVLIAAIAAVGPLIVAMAAYLNSKTAAEKAQQAQTSTATLAERVASNSDRVEKVERVVNGGSQNGAKP